MRPKKLKELSMEEKKLILLLSSLTFFVYSCSGFLPKFSEQVGCAGTVHSISGEGMSDRYVFGAINVACGHYQRETDVDAIALTKGIVIDIEFANGTSECRKMLGRTANACSTGQKYFQYKSDVVATYRIIINKHASYKYSLIYHEMMHVLAAQDGVKWPEHHTYLDSHDLCKNIERTGWWELCG